MRYDASNSSRLSRCFAGCEAAFQTKACLAIAALTTFALGAPVEARVVRFDVQSTQPFAGGMSFGRAGSFEELVGVATIGVDPHDPLNAGTSMLHQRTPRASSNLAPPS